MVFSGGSASVSQEWVGATATPLLWREGAGQVVDD
jgi:hypothetical protein